MPEVVPGIVVGGGIGGAQTLMLREYVDKPKAAPFIPRFGGFGTSSALAGIIGGGIATGIGIVLARKGRIGFGTAALLSYGTPALVSGFISGISPPFSSPTPRFTVAFPHQPQQATSQIKVVSVGQQPQAQVTITPVQAQETSAQPPPKLRAATLR